MPPNLTKKRVDFAFELVNEDITRMKSIYESPYVILGGDFNQFGVDGFVSDHPEFKIPLTPPTRTDARLDLFAYNLEDSWVEDIIVNDPLENSETKSDHLPLVCLASLPNSHHFSIIKYSTRKFTKKNEAKFIEELNEWDWENLLTCNDASEKTEILHKVIGLLMDKYFPIKSYSIKSTDKPWITDHARKEMKKRNTEYKLNGRTEKYHRLKKENETEIKGLKKNWYKKECDKLMTPGAISYNAIKNLNTATRPKNFRVMDLFPGREEHVAMESMADFFNQISGDFPALTENDVPVTFDRYLYDITPSMIVERVKNMKRPKSMVPGDVPPKLMLDVIVSLSVPLADIFNLTAITSWPVLWKNEYQTVIPKKISPTDLNDCRNLSCTNYFSKVLESFVLEGLLSEVPLSNKQFGGIKGCGTNHFLLDMWQNILEGLEEDNTAITLMSIDFSKAFNRMSHQACIKSLARKGCSNQSLRMVFGFLQGRQMFIKNGNNYSEPRQVNGGSPQGTKLGNFLFCATLDEIDVWTTSNDANHEQISEIVEENLGLEEGVEELSAVPAEYDREAISTPGTNTLINENFFTTNSGTRNKRHILRDTILEESYGIEGRKMDNWTLMYIDDLNIGEVHALETAQRHITQAQERMYVHARFCEETFKRISENAEDIKMKINSSKTQLLCISDPRKSDIISHIVTDGVKVSSVDTMKILGFVFGKSPNVTEHVKYIIGKFNRAIWSLTHLKRAGILEPVLLQIFKVMLRPHLEYCSPVFNPMLSKEQSNWLERQQKRALKVIYGFEESYEEILERTGVQTLEERREIASNDFALKLVKSERFSGLFPLNHYPEEMVGLRSQKKYKEKFARTDRLYKSPLYTMRRYFNQNYL